MSAVILGVSAAIVALRCQLISDDPYVLGSVSQVLPATRPAFLRALNATRRLIGCPEVDDPQEPDPPFGGGQCAGVGYEVTVTGQANPPGGPGFAIRNGLGPVSGLCFPDAGFGNRSIGVVFAGGCEISGGGQALTVSDVVDTWQISSITRVDGQPDNCGSPPPVYPPPNVFNFNTDITYEGDDGNDITVNVPFIFSPIKIDFNGNLRIPFNFDLGGFEFSGDINLPDFDVSINPPNVPPGSGEDLTGQGEDEPGETTPPAPLDEKIIGVVVTSTQTQSTAVTSYSTPGLTPIFIPRLGSVKFVYSIGAATFFSSDIDIKDRRTFIPCPFSQGADAVIASPNEGVNITFTPIRGFPVATTNDVQRAA